MGAKVRIGGVLIGNGQNSRWRNLTSPRQPDPRDTHVRVWFVIEGIPGNRAVTLSVTSEAFKALERDGDIKRSYMSHLGMLPEAVCEPGAEIVRKIYASGQADNEFTLPLRDKLQGLLNEMSAR